MWSLLAWKKPLDGMNEDQIKECIIGGASLPSVSPLPKGISSDYVDLMTECLRKDPASRPTADIVSSRLRAIDPSTRPAQPIDLIPPGFISDKATLLDCMLVAMPNERNKLELMIEKIVEFHATDVDAICTIQDYRLTPLEAQSISFYTFSADNGFEWQESPFFIYNKAVRMLDLNMIASWQHFSFFFISGLNKLPSVECDVFRGLDLRLTQMSHLYQKDGLVCQLFELSFKYCLKLTRTPFHSFLFRFAGIRSRLPPLTRKKRSRDSALPPMVMVQLSLKYGLYMPKTSAL